MLVLVQHVPDGLGVRIPRFHRGGPGSIPGLGVYFLNYLFRFKATSISDPKILPRIELEVSTPIILK